MIKTGKGRPSTVCPSGLWLRNSRRLSQGSGGYFFFMLEAAAINKPAKPINTKQVECLHRRFAFWAWSKQQPGSTRSVDISYRNLVFRSPLPSREMDLLIVAASPRVGSAYYAPALVMDCLFDFYLYIIFMESTRCSWDIAIFLKRG